ncbi:unnamed protein product [Lota lota]
MEGSSARKRPGFGHNKKESHLVVTHPYSTISDSAELSQPRKLNGSIMETPSHQDLHRELLLSHKRGLVLEEKPELKRVLEQRRLELHREEELAQRRPSDLEMELRKRQQKLQEYEQEEIRRREDQEKIPEFVVVKGKLRRTKTADLSATHSPWQPPPCPCRHGTPLRINPRTCAESSVGACCLLYIVCKSAEKVTMTAIESKDTDISDTDSGIIVHSGPDSPSIPVKDVGTHTRALKLKHQALEESLELCLLELRKLCIREAELTGELSSDYPLMPEEKPPRVRRRIGAAFKLDEGLIYQDGEDPELHSLAADLALQSQILEAARRLSLENNLSKPQKKSRLQQCKREERKFKDLQEAVTRQRARSERTSPQTAGSVHSLKDSCMSDDSSLSDAVALDDDMDPIDPPVGGSSYLDPLQQLPLQQSQGQTGVEHERSPIQNSPWKESSLDQPYQKVPTPQSACSSRSSSPVGAPVYPERILPSQFIKSLTMRHNHSCSAPSTPELHVRRQYSQSFRLPKNKLTVDVQRLGLEGGRARARLPQRRCAADFMVRSPEYSPRRLYQSSSEDSSSEHSVSSQASSPGCDGPSPTEVPKLCPPPYGFHYGAQGKGSVGPPGGYKNNNMNNNMNNIKNNYNYNSPASVEGSAHSLQGLSPLSPPNTSRTPQQQRPRPEEGFPSPGRAMKAPPPYSRLVRTPSLNEYPSHGSPVMPREVVSEELKSWHQRNKLQRFQPGSGDRLGRSHRINSPASPQPPPYKQGSGSVILQRAADGTPVQWFVEEDAEIVSQV